jgi:EmrB/QacA subfamily drug resistance transporter
MRAEKERLDPAFVRLAVILLTGVTVVVFDTTIVTVAIDTLSRDLHASVSATQWVISAYVLALAVVVPVAGWAAERFGAKQTWLSALAVFLAGSVLSSSAWNIGALIAFRVLQGIGGGLMLPILQTMLVRAAGRRKLGRIMAALSLPGLLGPILGPVIGGLIVGHLSWRWIFWVNVPFCVAGLVMGARGLERTPPHRGAYLDVAGLALLSPALAAVIYGFSEAGALGSFGHALVIVPLAAGAGLLGAFAVHALRASLPPLLDLRLLRVRSFSASASLLFISGLALYGAMLLLPLYYQQVRGQGAVSAGLLLAPQGIGTLLTRGWAGRLTDRVGARRIVLAGFLLTVAGTVACAQAGPYTSEILLGLSLIVRGAGLGAVTIPIMAAAYQGLGPDQIPHASGATRIAQQLGGSFGTAILAMILQIQVAAHRAGGLAGRVTAFDNAFWWSIGLTAIAVIPALALPGRPRPALGDPAATEEGIRDALPQRPTR